MLDISDSPSDLGLVVASASIPMVVSMLLGGAMADKHDHSFLVMWPVIA